MQFKKFSVFRKRQIQSKARKPFAAQTARGVPARENKGDNAQAIIGTIVQQDKEYITSLREAVKFLRDLISKG
ncbi:MAG: hypothetical protein LBS01_07775 [Prevotellaceae bacterium]|jgi:hypothetical protein|nr:hypothetical protein [Prevotellaceae bacterium]